MRWFKKKEKPVVAIEKPSSLFTTDIAIDTRSSRMRRITEALKQSFQTDYINVLADNATSAMDSVPSNIQQAKAYNTSGFFNPSINEAQLLYYAGKGFIGYQNAAMIAQHWLVDKACAMTAKDAVRHGYEITINDGVEVDPEISDYIKQRDKAFGIKAQCVELENMGRVFGIRIAIFKVNSTDPLYYEKPFNPDGVMPGSYKGITQVDPYWITPELDMDAAANPASLHFYEPTWWRVNGVRYHRTHLVIMRNGELADILKPSYLYGGIPVPQKIAERVFAAERTANEAPQLAMSKRLISVFTDLTQAQANQAAFETKMGWWTSMMNNFGVKILGIGDKLEQHDISLADVDDVIMTQFQLVSAAANVPVTKLLGTTPKGFNATGEYDESSYHEELESVQEHHLTPLVERHHLLLMRSEIKPKFGIEFGTSVAWKPVDSPSAKEQAEINAIKAETDSKWLQAGAIDGYDIRSRIIADPDSSYNGIEAVVPDGPGDRIAQQEAEAPLEEAVEASNKNKSTAADKGNKKKSK